MSRPVREHTKVAGMPHNKQSVTQREPGPPVKLSTLQRSWRVILVGIGLIILSVAQVISTNDWFPLGSLSQYSYARPLDGPTNAIRIRAVTEAGNDRGVPLSKGGVGIERSEIEGQVQRIVDDPSMLEGLARAWGGLYPENPAFVELRMERVSRFVQNGKPTGEESVEVLARWTVQGDYGNYIPKEKK